MVPEQRLQLKGIFSKIDYLGCPRDIFRRADVGGESLAPGGLLLWCAQHLRVPGRPSSWHIVPVATTLGRRMGANSTAALPQAISLAPSDCVINVGRLVSVEC